MNLIVHSYLTISIPLIAILFLFIAI
jgi:hypothetical protein